MVTIKIVLTVLADMSADFLVDINRPSRDILYSHSIQCVLLNKGMLTMSSPLLSFHSVLRTIMSAEMHKSCNPLPFVTVGPLGTGVASEVINHL